MAFSAAANGLVAVLPSSCCPPRVAPWGYCCAICAGISFEAQTNKASSTAELVFRQQSTHSLRHSWKTTESLASLSGFYFCFTIKVLSRFFFFFFYQILWSDSTFQTRGRQQPEETTSGTCWSLLVATCFTKGAILDCQSSDVEANRVLATASLHLFSSAVR